MKNMFLAIDIGNSNINIGVFDNDKIILSGRFATDTMRTAEQYAVEINCFAELKRVSLAKSSGAIISSVVPELTDVIKCAVSLLCDAEVMVLGPGVRSGLSIRIDNPAQLGADLVAGAVGAIDKYPVPCLVMDLGTATKISVIDSKCQYRGCTISAGVGISLRALSESASLLPTVNLNTENCPSFGTNTVSSMQAGIILGTASMLDGLCERIEAQLGEKILSYVSTGGLAESITSHCNNKVIYDPSLILHGLKVIYEKNIN